MTRTLPIACLAAAALSVVASPTRAEHLAEIFGAGNQAGYRGDWEEAARRYEALVAAGVDDPDVHFNLATAHAHAGKLGHAVLGFERALRLRSDDEAALAGLAAARAALGRRRAEREGEATIETRPPFVRVVLQPLSEELLAWLLLALDVLLFALLALRRYARGESLRVALAIAWPIAGLGCALAAGALLVKTDALADGVAGIVLREHAELLEGPTAQAQTRGAADEGASVRIVEREGRYARVRLPGGASGWMHENDVAHVGVDARARAD